MADENPPSLDDISGLRWQENWRLANGGDSFVIPFPRTRPTTIVFHGSKPFSYGHYGIHLGQQDRLTFLGSSKQLITARFVDCRVGSPTAGVKLEVKFRPSSKWELNIPPGVAHSFDGLEDIATLNNYDLFLPDPDDWMSGNTKWDFDADIVNLAEDFDQSELPLYEENKSPASDVYYRLVAENQEHKVKLLKSSYPYTHEHSTPDGPTYIIKVHEKIQDEGVVEWENISDIDGLGWLNNPAILSGQNSGFVPLVSCRPYYVVDHGFSETYTHDAYGIHLGQQDRLIFLGDEQSSATVEFVDCRHGSPTLHDRVSATFSPNAKRTLVIPAGVAHRFENLQGIFTINQGSIFLNANADYEPGNDVIDWPVTRTDFPVLDPNTTPADDAYYALLARSQIEVRQKGDVRSTPIVVMAKDAFGNDVRVAIRGG